MIKRFFAQEWAKLRVMNFREKREYIWEYYKIHIILTAFALFVIGSFINVWFINPPPRHHLHIAWQAGIIHTDSLDELGDRLSVIVPDQDRYRVTVQSYVLMDEPQLDEALMTRFVVMITAGDLHATISSSQGILEGAEFGFIKPITSVLDVVREYNQELYEYFADRLLTISYTLWLEEDTPTHTDAMGIRISGAPMLLDMGIMWEGLYLGIIVNSTQIDATAHALLAMFDAFIPEEDVYTAS